MVARLIQIPDLKEGEVFNKWLHSRLIVNNKNVLGAELGATGSGKSYRDLRKGELWYEFHFNEPFPQENICFGVAKIMQRLSSGELRKGEVLIFEEAGANLGSLDFQTKVSKMFTYVLQSFRSMNVAIFFNLPYLSMLNKQARMLLHYSFESSGINFQDKTNMCKPFFHQVNQGSGKIFRKYMRVKYKGKVRTVKRMTLHMPSEGLADIYEKKKQQYLSEMTSEYVLELQKLEEDKLAKLDRPTLTDKQLLYKKYREEGLSVKEIAEKQEVSERSIYFVLKTIKKKGYELKFNENPLENEVLEASADI